MFYSSTGIGVEWQQLDIHRLGGLFVLGVQVEVPLLAAGVGVSRNCPRWPDR
jgi:hypothetical protein